MDDREELLFLRGIAQRYYSLWLETHSCMSDDCYCLDFIHQMHQLQAKWKSEQSMEKLLQALEI